MYILVLCLPLISAQIGIFSPPPLRNKYQSGIIGSLGNFGNPPYDSSINGYAWFPDPPLGCMPITNPNEYQDSINLIAFFDRGDCAFVLKVKHAQDAGAKAVIIVNNDPAEDITKITMRDNGLGGNLYIPAYLISQKDGKAIKEVIDSGLAVTLVLKFEITTMVDTINLDMWLSSGNKRSKDFLKEFALIGKQLTRQNSDFNPHYVFIKCLTCEQNSFATEHADCLGGGRYCAPDPDGEGKLTGRDVVKEDLRQMCMFKQISDNEGYSRWFEFQEIFTDRCNNADFSKECSENVMSDMGFDVSVMNQCYRKSFDGGQENSLSKNSMLAAEMEMWHGNGLHFYPAIIINGQLYRGDLENSAVLNGICAGYQRKYEPEFCKYKETGGVKQEGFSTKTVVIVLVVFFVAVAAVLLIYRHIAKKELQKEMRMQVNSAVSQYFALSDTSTFKKSDRPSVKASYV